MNMVSIKSLNPDVWVLSDENTIEYIRRIENRGVPLGSITQIHAGLTTLADNLYIFEILF